MRRKEANQAMKCRICGQELEEKMKFCPECGRAVRPWDRDNASEQTERDIWTLSALLHYHERMMLAEVQPVCSNAVEGRCATKVFCDAYADALKEAIRCIRMCHGLG